MQELFIVFFVEIKNEMGIWSTVTISLDHKYCSYEK